MNYAIVLAGGIGQRMRSGGTPKQFLKLMNKPIICYTLERIYGCELIDKVIITCHGGYVDTMEKIVKEHFSKNDITITVGGEDRQGSVLKGFEKMSEMGAKPDDIVLIHDGVRPLVTDLILRENIRCAKEYGAAITVRTATEVAIVTSEDSAGGDDFYKRNETYLETSPQTFSFGEIKEAYSKFPDFKGEWAHLLDAAMVYMELGGRVHLVKDQSPNLKVTTPEDYYVLRALIEMEENKNAFGL